MKTLLVATDLSINSIAGVRFAIQLAAQTPIKLVFFHVSKLMKRTVVPDIARKARQEEERDNLREELERFVRDVYNGMSMEPQHCEFVVYYHFGVVHSIIDYAERNNISYICISTHGAGNVAWLLGTTASALISESRIPLLCIPRGYQARPITSLLYASDLKNCDRELEMVTEFAGPINAEVQMLHFYTKESPAPAVIASFQKKYKYEVAPHFEEKNETLLDEIDQAVTKLTPSILVMFTLQDRPFFNLLFTGSNTEKYSFRSQVPMLVFHKNDLIKTGSART